MAYVQGYVAAVPNANRKAFEDSSEIMIAMMKEYGALECVDCWGVDVPDGKITSFPRAVNKKDDETVTFSWAIWPDKATCDAAMEKIMSDPRMTPDVMPFDGERMIFGSFEKIGGG
ncbi:DUF1428 domain-containing protein [Maricaulis sp.]|uniref:DUF1428 domain-containing protein n=1 Tax=Maricaulis sp. TaxID=1486257 RepID=UPI003A94F8F1